MKNQPTQAELNASRLATDQIIAEVTKEVMSKAQPDTFDTLLVKKINALMVECFNQFSSMHKLNVTPMRKTEAVEHIRKLYKDKLTTWSKDELVESFALTQAVLGAESFHDQLI